MIHRINATQTAEAPLDLPGAEKVYPDKLKKIVTDISQLTLLEVADLNELLKVCRENANLKLEPIRNMFEAVRSYWKQFEINQTGNLRLTFAFLLPENSEHTRCPDDVDGRDAGGWPGSTSQRGGETVIRLFSVEMVMCKG